MRKASPILANAPGTKTSASLGRICVFAAAALVIGCESPAEPDERPEAAAGILERIPTRQGGKTSECARRVQIQRTASAWTGINGVTPDSVAQQTMSGSGGFQVSFGASSGGGGLGAQSWTKQSTTVNCDSWSIGRQGLLLLDGSGWGDMRAQTRANPGSRGLSRAQASSQIQVTFELERNAEMAVVVHLDQDWVISQEPNSASWAICSGIQALLERTTFGSTGTIGWGAVHTCEGSDPAQNDSFQVQGNLTPGNYKLTIGDHFSTPGINALSTGGPSSAETFATGKWRFQFVLKEL